MAGVGCGEEGRRRRKGWRKAREERRREGVEDGPWCDDLYEPWANLGTGDRGRWLQIVGNLLEALPKIGAATAAMSLQCKVATL